jgi:hypothetical protein
MSPRINLCTALRQGSTYTYSFFHQVKALTERGYELGSVTVVVDGETLTDPTLVEAQTDPRVSFVFEGPRGAPTCFMHERSIAWARTGNLALDASLTTPSEHTLWIESDLSFPCDLIELLMEPNQDIVAPIVMLGENFYDSWGFRDLAGRRIANLAELQALPRGPRSLTELSSVGSCLLFRTSLLGKGVRMPARYENGLLVGFCLAARATGARVFCRHDVVIVHPTSLWAEQVYRVMSCRIGDAQAWQELAPAGGAIVAGPYFDFVIPEAVRLLECSAGAAKTAANVAYACNARREIAILLGDGEALPPAPEGFGSATAHQPMPKPKPKVPPAKAPWWSKLLSR